MVNKQSRVSFYILNRVEGGVSYQSNVNIETYLSSKLCEIDKTLYFKLQTIWQNLDSRYTWHIAHCFVMWVKRSLQASNRDIDMCLYTNQRKGNIINLISDGIRIMSKCLKKRIMSFSFIEKQPILLVLITFESVPGTNQYLSIKVKFLAQRNNGKGWNSRLSRVPR